MKKEFLQLRCLLFTSVLLVITAITTQAQVAINNDGTTPDNSAMLDVKSSDKGLLIPRLTTTARTALASTAAAGLMVYDTDLHKFFLFNGTTWEETSTGGRWSYDTNNVFLADDTDSLGIGTNNPARKFEVHGGWQTARLSTSTSGAFLEFESLDSPPDWAIGTWGGEIRFLSSTDDFQNTTDQYIFGTTSFSPWFNNSISLGGMYSQWSNLFSVDGNFSGDLYAPSLKTSVRIYDSTTQNTQLSLNAKAIDDSSSLRFAEGKDAEYGMYLLYDGTENELETWGYYGSVRLGPYMVIERDNGNVGVGVANPSSRLHVAATGNNRTSFFTGEGTGISGATVYSSNTGSHGIAGFFETYGDDATFVISQHGTSGPFFKAFGPNGGAEEIKIDNDGLITFYNSNHTATIYIDPSKTGGTDGGQITLYDASGTRTIEIDGDYGGNGRITTNELQITGGSDLSEYFDISNSDNIREGMVVSIDENNPGHLTISKEKYDKKVAGILSGSNDIKPGLMMSQKGSIADGEHLIALSGRVYCLVDATKHPVHAGDFLTTSDTPGYAMKVKDYEKARGAIIGKAMTSLKSGKGLVLVLVSLQ